MRDFTFHTFYLLLQALKQQYNFQSFTEFLKAPAQYSVILRHDVDARSRNSLVAAEIEASLGLHGTYYFRMVPSSFNTRVITTIASLGHEIGYHYEDLSIAKGNYDKAIRMFEKNLAKLRCLAPVTTICMHGSPLSRFDNRKLWDKYNYREYGIAGEPYFDLDFEKILYLTDTGRRWDGEKFSIRDKATNETQRRTKGTDSKKSRQGQDNTIGESAEKEGNPVILHSTFDIIRAAANNHLPDKIMITVHPQRWNDRMWPWVKEYVMQNVKNIIKAAIVR